MLATSSASPLASWKPRACSMSGNGTAVTTRTNGGTSPSTLRAGCPWHACRRPPRICCRQIARRRATSVIVAPARSASATIRTFSSSDHRRRRPGPGKASIRQNPAFAMSLITPMATFRCSNFASIQHRSPHYRNRRLGASPARKVSWPGLASAERSANPVRSARFDTRRRRWSRNCARHSTAPGAMDSSAALHVAPYGFTRIADAGADRQDRCHVDRPMRGTRTAESLTTASAGTSSDM